jgi:hypothetical protein
LYRLHHFSAKCDEIKEDEMVRECIREMRYAQRVLVEKHEGKRTLGNQGANTNITLK